MATEPRPTRAICEHCGTPMAGHPRRWKTRWGVLTCSGVEPTKAEVDAFNRRCAIELSRRAAEEAG